MGGHGMSGDIYHIKIKLIMKKNFVQKENRV